DSKVIKAIDDIIIDDNTGLNDLDSIKYKLQICDGLLSFWKKCVERVSVLEKVQAAYVASLCNILPETTRTIFEHCKASPKYGALLSGAMQELKNLFAKASEVFKLFFATLNGVIVFDTDVQSETELLTKVVDAYGNIASIANGMDTKTFVELSEAFAKLAIVHQNDINSNNVMTYLIRMAKDTSYLFSIIEDQNDKNTERNVMIAMRLLRILEKLTSSYGAFFTHEMISHLIELLTRMHGYCCLTKSSEKTILASATSFLNIIFNHNDFKQVYFEYGKQIVPHDQYVCRLNYHLLTIAIMKKLNSMPYEHHCKWSLGSDSILDVAFTFIDYLEEEICAEDLRLPGICGIGERIRFVSIYEATVVSICSLASQIPPEGFHALELLLLKHLLSGNFWSSLLSSDVWCFIGREAVNPQTSINFCTILGSSQLCVDHIKHLIKVSAALVERHDSIEAIMLDNMIIRLCDLLNEDMKSTLFDNLINLDTDYDAFILYLLMAKTKSLSSERLKRKIEDLPKAFLDLHTHTSTCNWKRLMQIMSVMTAVNYSDNRDVINVLTKIWSFVASAIIECEDKQLDLLSDLIVILLNATCLKYLHDDSFCTVLMSVTTSCVHLPPQGKIKICHFLRRNVENLGRCSVQSVTSTLIELFSHLLEDEDPWVRQEALETFEHVGHMCLEQLVAEIAKVLAKIPGISGIMQAYLSLRPYYVFKGFTNIQDYLRYLAKAVQNHGDEHRCYEYNEFERKDKMLKLEEEKNSREVTVPMLIQLDEQAEMLYKGFMKVLEDQAVISEAMCRRLMTILEKILRVQGNKNSQN
ncbi:Uncharacterized protein C1orf112, partial [Acromyrmex echinatior]